MTRASLFREYARVIEMCDGLDVDPNACVRGGGTSSSFEKAGTPAFTSNCEYTFALCILENKPVFAGDRLYYGEHSGTATACHDDMLFTRSDSGVPFGNMTDKFSWNPPVPERETISFHHYGDRLHLVTLKFARGEACNVELNDMLFSVERLK